MAGQKSDSLARSLPNRSNPTEQTEQWRQQALDELEIVDSGAHPVIGTSGLLSSQVEALQQRCQEQRLGGIIVPNFSIAAILMMRFASMAARFMPEVEIIEAHHRYKIQNQYRWIH